MKNLISPLLIVLFYISFSCSSQNNSKNIEYNDSVQKCFNQKRIINDSLTNCIPCFIKLIEKYPDSLSAYQFLTNEYLEINDYKSADSIIDISLNKFGSLSDILIQKNMVMFSKENKINHKEINVLIKRYESGELTDDQTLGLAVLLSNVNDKKNLRKINLTSEQTAIVKAMRTPH